VLVALHLLETTSALKKLFDNLLLFPPVDRAPFRFLHNHLTLVFASFSNINATRFGLVLACFVMCRIMRRFRGVVMGEKTLRGRI
jgi:hypothetical protein